MYALFRNVPLRNLISMQVPASLVHFVIAKLFYKFHSFTLECLAFGTWFAIDGVVIGIRRLWFDRRSTVPIPDVPLYSQDLDNSLVEAGFYAAEEFAVTRMPRRVR
jgi:hypothetical protein